MIFEFLWDLLGFLSGVVLGFFIGWMYSKYEEDLKEARKKK